MYWITVLLLSDAKYIWCITVVVQLSSTFFFTYRKITNSVLQLTVLKVCSRSGSNKGEELLQSGFITRIVICDVIYLQHHITSSVVKTVCFQNVLFVISTLTQIKKRRELLQSGFITKLANICNLLSISHILKSSVVKLAFSKYNIVWNLVTVPMKEDAITILRSYLYTFY